MSRKGWYFQKHKELQKLPVIDPRFLKCLFCGELFSALQTYITHLKLHKDGKLAPESF